MFLFISIKDLHAQNRENGRRDKQIVTPFLGKTVTFGEK